MNRVWWVGLALAAALASAHVQDAGKVVRISGRVLDRSAAAIPGAHVALKAPGRPDVTASTDAHGEFAFPAVPAGQYEMGYVYPGFKPTTQRVDASAGVNIEVSVLMDALDPPDEPGIPDLSPGPDWIPEPPGKEIGLGLNNYLRFWTIFGSFVAFCDLAKEPNQSDGVVVRFRGTVSRRQPRAVTGECSPAIPTRIRQARRSDSRDAVAREAPQDEQERDRDV